MKLPSLSFGSLLALVVLLGFAGCAGEPPARENLLTKAGFRSMPANSPAKQALLKPLEPGVVTPVLFQKRYYYVVREEKREAVLVGGPVELRVYENLRARRNLPADGPKAEALKKPVDWTAWRGLNDGWYSFAL